ncbi:DUF4442 domain-containing protein [Marinobacter sp. M216]|uniref:DUF4442 domain-containing protein n=1 Tax=Marinobacter albus TaxID=3030833 RepID=A0ABT7HCZ8_9GAMM|nr:MULTISPECIES: DUF4442 domain-containing protein [unclassified Marinobacter]MBW7469497.1 DUF4442 domain-containing protein [Marinobacter sp. F4218]MDK9558234.1 DUF4442 domain-containing protein [Marinobacter sp. M216]
MIRAKESFESRLWRWAGNLFPAYRRVGARVTYVSPDFYQVHVKIPSNWQTRNHMGMTWGGGLYSALDPIYGVMIYKLLGYRHRVVDKCAEIHFRKPGRTTLYAKFQLSPSEIDAIRLGLASGRKVERTYQVELVDQAGVVHVSCLKTLCIFASP